MTPTWKQDIYFKQTHLNYYLLFSSSQPKHRETNIQFNLTRRICTNISDPKSGEKKLQELENTLSESEYPIALIHPVLELLDTIDNQELRKTGEPPEAVNILTYVSTQNARNVKSYYIICPNMLFLLTDPRISKAVKIQQILKI